LFSRWMWCSIWEPERDGSNCLPPVFDSGPSCAHV
jgi:hypothetical protein